MKKGSFKCLVMREFYMCRKNIIPLFLLFVGLAGLVFLLQLSFKVGNLTLLPKEFRADFIEMFKTVCFFPVAISNCMLEGMSVTSAVEGETKWKRFRLASPVKPIRLAAAKYTMMLILFAFSTLLVVVYIKVIDVMNVITVDKDFVAICLMLFLVMIVFEVATQVLAMFFGSVDKAGMTIMGVLFACMFLFMGNVQPWSDANAVIYEQMVGFCRGFMGYVPVCIVAVFAAGFGATTMLYKRREK